MPPRQAETHGVPGRPLPGRAALDVHHAGPASVVRAHGRLILAGAAVGAGGLAVHAALRPYLHPEFHAGMVRDHVEVERDRAFIRNHDHDFPGRDARAFHGYVLEAWRRGVWRDEWHYGRRGWWWETGGVWYPYGDPVYPYPLTVAPLQVYDTTETQGPEPPPPYDAQGAGPAPPQGYAGAPGAPPPPGAQQAGIEPLPAPAPGWYRCGEPAGYYPSVGACNGPWTLVQEAPPGAQ